MNYVFRSAILGCSIALLSACGGSSSTSNDTTSEPGSTTPQNSAATGSVTLTGTGEAGQTLTSNNTISDANGLGTLNYQWLRNGAAITNSTSASYVIHNDDVNKPLSLVISFTDNDGFNESITSNAVTPTAVVITPTDPVATSSPNILLIIADDMGVDASAQYSYSDDPPTTPTLDALAEQGIVFDNMWATPKCTTTRATIMTGQHGVSSGVDYVPATLATDSQTLPRYLKSNSQSAEYSDAVIGKWHLGGGQPALTHPNDTGVSYYAGHLGAEVDDYFQWPLVINGVEQTSNVYHTTAVTDLAINWIDNQSKPWLLWLAFAAPHSPFHLPPSDLHNRTTLTGSVDDIAANRRSYYLAAIEAMDTEIARLLSTMSQDERDNTLIIFIGDNGTPKGVIDSAVFGSDHAKGSLYEGGIRVPMIVSGQGVSRKNVRESALINTTDLFSTIADIAGHQSANYGDSKSFASLLSTNNSTIRALNYSEFVSDDVEGWVVRNNTHKLIQLADNSQMLFDINADISETSALSLTNNQTLVDSFIDYAKAVRGETSTNSPLDITNAIFDNRSSNCADYAQGYKSSVLDVNNSTVFNGDLTISATNGKCLFSTNAIPNHDFNDGNQAFPNDVSAQNIQLEISAAPSIANSVTALSLGTDNALFLNGVKVDLLAAGCYGVGNGKVGCNDINTPWRYDPMHPAAGFNVDSHNAHAQPTGAYHYHGNPNAMFDNSDSGAVSPVIGFAADGFPIYGPFYDDNGTVKRAAPSYKIKDGTRPSGPGGAYDGSFRDDYEYVSGLGTLDECNGMTLNGSYGYYVTDGYPYVLGCYKGTPDPSFKK